MDNTSRMRIICNPFKKEIEYQWFDLNREEYVDLDPENSKLASEEFINATIQSRAYEIIDIINCECNVGNLGLEIIFVGTEDDYCDFCDVISNYNNGEANIKCVRDEEYYNTAGFVLPKIKEKFTLIKRMLEEYTEDEIAKLVYKYNDAVRPSISLCVMGLYSAGKSAFINSIIGAEILPSASDPTTAKVYKIYCDVKYQICFSFDKKECALKFDGETFSANSNYEKEILKELQNIENSNEKHDEIFNMNRALEVLNNYNNAEHEISDIIEIHIPFGRTVLPIEEFDFVIYDTPGSNSDNNIRHFEVLKDSLDEQTNALPIFLTTPDSMDAEDNDKILNLIEETGTSLDTTNAIVIVNKSDEKGPKTLREKRDKCQNLRITKWKSTRIFFVSSLIALASKKNNPHKGDEWIDEDMYEIYTEKEENYSTDKRKLYEFNIIDKSKADDFDEYIDARESTHLYRNSGLESVEKEIVEYARKYALYNKCQQASSYLQKAIQLCVENIQENEKKMDSALQKAKGHFDAKKSELCDKLEAKKEDLASYNSDFQNLIGKDFSDFTKNHHLVENSGDMHILQEDLKNEWKRLKEVEKKEKKENKWVISRLQGYVDRKYNELLRAFSKKVNAHIDSFWDEKSVVFKDDCKKIVHNSDALTDEQKRILESIVLSKNNMSMYRMGFDLRKLGAIKPKRFLFWETKDEKFDSKACSEQLIKQFNDAVRKRIGDSESTNERNFKKWTDSLISTLMQELCKFNTELSSFEKQIETLNADIEAKKDCEKMLVASKKYIDNLLSKQGGEMDG